jgi:single-stranded DNA-binding protein
MLNKVTLIGNLGADPEVRYRRAIEKKALFSILIPVCVIFIEIT